MAFLNFEWVKDDRDEKILFEKDAKEKKPKTKKGFVLDWESALGWKENPFKDEVKLPIKDFISGFTEERKKLNLFFIHNSRFGLIKGAPGTGKTILLKWLGYELLNFQKKFIVCYIPAKEIRYEDFLKKMIKPFRTFHAPKFMDKFQYTRQNVYQFIKGKNNPSKNIALLIDNIENLSHDHLSLVKDIFGAMRNVHLIATIDIATKGKIDISDLGDDEAGIIISKMSAEDLTEMIEKRIEAAGGIDIEPFTTAQLRANAKKSGYEPREFLKICNKQAIELSVVKKEDTGYGNAEEEYKESEDIRQIEKDLAQHDVDVTYETESHDIEVENSSEEYEGDKVVQEVLGKASKKKSPAKKTSRKK